MAAIKTLSYRTVDELIDSARIDLKNYQSAGDIDAAELIKVAQRINYELGLRIYQWKESIIEIDHHRARLPADFHQLQLALVCHRYNHIQTAPWNGNVLYEQVEGQWPLSNTTSTSGSTNCDICNITHVGPCPELVINPYPLGKCRTICNGDVNIKILQYCSAEVRCYENFERLYIVPHSAADGFNSQNQFNTSWHNTGSIINDFLETPSIECGKVYVSYLGAMEDDNGNLLVLDHPEINSYYYWSLVEKVLENLYLNGEDLIQRVQYAAKKKEEYRYNAMSIVNMPDFRDCINVIETLRKNHNRQYYHPLSRWYGHLGIAIPYDNM